MKKLLLLLFVCSFVKCSQSSQDIDSNVVTDYSAAINSTLQALERVKANTDIPGMAVTVMIDGEIVFTKGLGFSDLENKVEVDPSKTLFRIGSVSKSMTSISMARLFDEGKLDFDETIQTYVPDFPEKRRPINVRQVAGHMAGIRHYKSNEMMSDKFYPTVTEGLEIFKNDTLLFEPGTDYSYSSYGWNLISAVVEGAAGEPFLDYMESKVFGPLGMNNTKADLAPEDMANRTKFYFYNGSETLEARYVDNSYKWAGGGFISTSQDLTKLGHSMLEPKIIKAATVDLLITPQYVNDTVSTNYGMGWSNRTRDDGKQWFGHSGGSVGGITQLVIYPKDKIVVGLVSNSSDVDYAGVHHKIVNWFSEASK